MKKIIVFLFLFPGKLFAYYPCRDMQILWQLNATGMRIPDVTIPSGNTASYFDIELPTLAPTTSAVVSWIQRYNVPQTEQFIPSGNGSKNIVTWLAIPQNNQSISLGSGLTGRIDIISGGYDKRGIYNGYQTYSGKYKIRDWKGMFFPNTIAPGYRYSAVENNFLSTKLRVTMEKGSAFSGRYNISLPIKIGSEEWYKGEKVCSNGAGIEPAVVNMANIFPSVNVNVVASCEVVGNKSVSINHGSITPAQARDGHFAKYQLTVNCSSPTNVKISINGNHLISGADKNVTRCGNNGKCTLTVEGAKDYSGVINGSKIFDITSQYRAININNIYSGAFSGSAVATLLMQ